MNYSRQICDMKQAAASFSKNIGITIDNIKENKWKYNLSAAGLPSQMQRNF